jgi:phenylalanine-4-hydroxylase
MRTRYNFDEYQQTYFVVGGFEDLLRATEETDFASVYRKIAGDLALEPGDAWRGDVAYEGRLPAAPASGDTSLGSGRRATAAPISSRPRSTARRSSGTMA